MHACGAKPAGDRYGLASTTLILCRALLADSNPSFPRSGPTRFADGRELGQNGKYSCRKTGAALRLRKRADDECAGFRDLIEVREQLDLIVIST